jgi:hypothetical protein
MVRQEKKLHEGPFFGCRRMSRVDTCQQIGEGGLHARSVQPDYMQFFFRLDNSE